MIVVSNSSPLIALARIGKLQLLATFYERVLIPVEVQHEVTVAGSGLPGAEEVRKAKWIEVAPQKISLHPALVRACQGLGAGERAAILLAKSLSADLVLLDDRKARAVAHEADLAIAGCLGILEDCSGKGLVPDLRQAYVDLLGQRNPIRHQAPASESGSTWAAKVVREIDACSRWLPLLFDG